MMPWVYRETFDIKELPSDLPGYLPLAHKAEPIPVILPELATMEWVWAGSCGEGFALPD